MIGEVIIKFLKVFIVLALIESSSFFIVLVILNNRLKRNHFCKRHKNWFCRMKGINKLLQIILPFTLVIALLVTAIIVQGKEKFDTSKHLYIQTSLASQSEVSLLFSQEVKNNESDNKESELLAKLHIPESFINAKVSKNMFYYFDEKLSPIYKNGTKSKSVGTDMADYEDAEYIFIDNDYIREANYWKNEYISNHQPPFLYQYGRALNDAAMTLDDLPFSSMIEITADAVSSVEKFLSYNSRNINTNMDMVIINVENISLMNGKLLLHVATIASSIEEGKSYENCLLVEAYVCVERGLNQIDEKNPQYALLAYYLGCIGERLLFQINKIEDSVLYEEIGKKAIKSYEQSLEMIENNPNLYAMEIDMENRLKKSISTLHYLGFFAE